MKQRFSSTLFILLIPCISFSQNLVLNGSFESTEGCTEFISGFRKVKEWSNPTLGTTDLFNDCIVSHAGMPNNYNGTQVAHHGHKYAGIYCYSHDDYREYIQGKISRSLKAGKEYKLKFFISLAEASDFAIKEFSILFLPSELNLSTSEELSKKQLRKIKNDKYAIYPIENEMYYDNTERWIPLELTFTASGNESYFIIGNFNKNSRTDKRAVSKKNRQNISYYYIDNVSLVDTSVTIENSLENVAFTARKETIKTESQRSFLLNSTYTLKSIRFEFDKATVLEESTAELNELILYLIINPKLHITINGHTDYLGNAAYNQKLSEDRAKSVADYLINNGITKDRIKYKGYGESQPIDPNEPEDAQIKNRRVEFVLSN
ncbi:OmpA family protein [uncultured Nonlabens sp.]|uniref:OmpA family protein n=1 Tax=uncultured Nonlabens sp. TaxID=859306 RepID=UPI00260FCBA2|nr:OmpA family protein [uncultured Nonlabens sp.]